MVKGRAPGSVLLPDGLVVKVVKGGAFVVRFVGARGAEIRAVEQGQVVFGVRVVAEPAFGEEGRPAVVDQLLLGRRLIDVDLHLYAHVGPLLLQVFADFLALGHRAQAQAQRVGRAPAGGPQQRPRLGRLEIVARHQLLGKGWQRRRHEARRTSLAHVVEQVSRQLGLIKGPGQGLAHAHIAQGTALHGLLASEVGAIQLNTEVFGVQIRHFLHREFATEISPHGAVAVHH